MGGSSAAPGWWSEPGNGLEMRDFDFFSGDLGSSITTLSASNHTCGRPNHATSWYSSTLEFVLYLQNNVMCKDSKLVIKTFTSGSQLQYLKHTNTHCWCVLFTSVVADFGQKGHTSELNDSFPMFHSPPRRQVYRSLQEWLTESVHDDQSLHFCIPVSTETCLLSEASGFLSPSAGSTSTCVMYSFNVSDTQKRGQIQTFISTARTSIAERQTWWNGLSQPGRAALAGNERQPTAGFLNG